mmetsp:Transcript_4115/g.6277  ORF Transcript_4115/g.6277 Transcript_4115/m.6277 type:complete len:86 (-) Transcript_4115:9-266(-)
MSGVLLDNLQYLANECCPLSVLKCFLILGSIHKSLQFPRQVFENVATKKLTGKTMISTENSQSLKYPKLMDIQKILPMSGRQSVR